MAVIRRKSLREIKFLLDEKWYKNDSYYNRRFFNDLRSVKNRNMILNITISTIYECSLERAFKSLMLCALTKIHTGYGIIPKVTHTSEDENWGKVGSTKKVFTAKSLTQKGGFASIDSVLERNENQYWKIQVDNFQSWMLGYYKFVGEWKTTQLEQNKILVEYTYSLHSNNPLFYPFNWLFARTFWKKYMRRVLENVRHLAYNHEPYLYE